MSDLIVDANIVVRSVLGRCNVIAAAAAAGATLIVVDAQLVEAASVLDRIVGSENGYLDQLAPLLEVMTVVPQSVIATQELSSRQRLDARGQRDWPVLAAALSFDAEIWSDDRDFFGVGVSVWSSRNITYAFRSGARNV